MSQFPHKSLIQQYIVPAHTTDNVMIMFETPTYDNVLQYVEDMFYSSKNMCKESLYQCCFTTLKENCSGMHPNYMFKQLTSYLSLRSFFGGGNTDISSLVCQLESTTSGNTN